MSDFRLNNDPRPTSLPDVFVRDVPLEARRRISEAAERVDDDNAFETLAELGLLLFEEVIVDQQGKPYDNIRTVDDVRAMGMTRLLDTQNAVLEEMSPGKHSAPTARSRSKSTSSSKGTRRSR